MMWEHPHENNFTGLPATPNLTEGSGDHQNPIYFATYIIFTSKKRLTNIASKFGRIESLCPNLSTDSMKKTTNDDFYRLPIQV